ncbi:MAG: hypothetical protein C4289_07605, partial [Chloroflexota bacterium]
MKRSDDALVEEEILPVRVDLEGRPLADLEADLALLADRGSAGEVDRSALERFRHRFESLRDAAAEEA